MDVNGLLTRILSRTHIFHGKVPWILVNMFNQSIEITAIHNPVVFTLFSVKIFWEASGQLERRVGHGQGIFFVAQYYYHTLTPTSAPSIGFATHHERDEQFDIPDFPEPMLAFAVKAHLQYIFKPVPTWLLMCVWCLWSCWFVWMFFQSRGTAHRLWGHNLGLKLGRPKVSIVNHIMPSLNSITSPLKWP